jgi:hypothetical protein
MPSRFAFSQFCIRCTLKLFDKTPIFTQAYFSDGLHGDEQRAIVYSEELGVAIEQLKPGFTISELWEINVD